LNIVLDTNCLIQILPRPSEHRWIYEAILRGEINLAVTTEILEEYAEVLDAFFESETLGDLTTKVIIELPGTQKKTVYFRFLLIHEDADDNKFVDCAVAANAACILTNDHHFKALKKIAFPKVTTVTIEQFLSFWQKRK
jgi:uncharacterized protein